MSQRPYHIILIGATGFTGRRAAKYLKNHAPGDLKIGLAARNEKKLHKLAEELHFDTDTCFVVDTLNKDRVEEVVKKTSIILTTAGPFSLYGKHVIGACAAHGTHYLDITGEVGFIKNMKDEYEAAAIESGAMIIPFCGFDSIPADLTAFLLSKRFEQPEQLSIRSYYQLKGGFNGGTIATMLNKFETGEFKQMNDPALLAGKTEQDIKKPEFENFIGFDQRIGRWSIPFIMGAINSKIVYASAASMRKHYQPYAKSISYSEHSSLGKWYNPFPLIFMTLMLLSITKLGPYAWFRNLLRKITPDPGEGPSESQIENGFFKLSAYATDENGKQESLSMFFPGDASNKATVFFLCESALCLATQKHEPVKASGFFTPITAFGQNLVDRLSQKGLQIT